MKKATLILIALSFGFAKTHAQNENPYSMFGYKGKVLQTPEEESGKQYLFISTKDTTQKLKSIAFNTKTHLIEYIDYNNVIYKTDSLLPTSVLRWLSIDPLAQKYPSISPYASFANSPIYIIDTDGREIKALSGVDAKSLQTAFNQYKSFFKVQTSNQRTNIGGASGVFASTNVFSTNTEESYFNNKLAASNLSDVEKAQATAVFKVLSSQDIIEIGIVKATEPAAPTVREDQPTSVIKSITEFYGSTNADAKTLLKNANKNTENIQSALSNAPISGATTSGGAYRFFPQPANDQTMSTINPASGANDPRPGNFVGTLLINPGSGSQSSFGGTTPNPTVIATQDIIQSIKNVADKNVVSSPR